MNWLDIESQVLDKHEDAWEMGRTYHDQVHTTHISHSMFYPLATAVGAFLVRCGCRLQGRRETAEDLRVLRNGRVGRATY